MLPTIATIAFLLYIFISVVFMDFDLQNEWDFCRLKV